MTMPGSYFVQYNFILHYALDGIITLQLEKSTDF